MASEKNTTLQDIVADIRTFMYGGMRTLPITLAGTMTILGLFTANYAFLFFLIGFLLLTPIASYPLNLFIIFIFKNSDFIKVQSSDICKINVPYDTITSSKFAANKEPIGSSAWIAMTSFFIGYVFTNAFNLYGIKAETGVSLIDSNEKKEDIEKTNNLKYRVGLSMASVLLFAVVAMIYRFKTGCENPLSMACSVLFALAGYGWYELLSYAGNNRLSDIFGIANRLILPSAADTGPVACVPI